MKQDRIDFAKAGRVNRRPVSLSKEGIVKIEEPLDSIHPLIIRPTIDGVDLASWISAPTNRDLVENHVSVRGSVLLRGFTVKSINDFEAFIKAAWGDLLEYTYGSTPRSLVSGNIYTSTEYPPDQFIPLHNEMSYTTAWPNKICFFCVQPAEQGGETPIADSRRVLARIPLPIRERFAQHGVMYMRNYVEGVDVPWQNVFQTENPSDVDHYCRNRGIKFVWKDKNHLKTWQVCQAMATHPKTGEEVWFNQAHLFHISSLSPAIQRDLLSRFQEDNLPRNAYYGDGTHIEEAVLMTIRDAYQQETRTIPWQTGDVMVLDNMLTAHGRTPFAGKRKIVVGMSEPYNTKSTSKTFSQ